MATQRRARDGRRATRHPRDRPPHRGRRRAALGRDPTGAACGIPPARGRHPERPVVGADRGLPPCLTGAAPLGANQRG